MNVKFYNILVGILSPFLLQAQFAFTSNSVSTLPDPVTRKESAMKRSIYATDVRQNLGKQINLCSKVYHAKPIKSETGKLVQMNVGGAYMNERIEVRLRFDDEAKLTPDLPKDLEQKSFCIAGQVIDLFGETEIFVDTANTRMMFEEALQARAEKDTAKVFGKELKLLSSAYLLTGPKWKEEVITHLKAGTIVKAEKVLPGWVFVKVIEKNGFDVQGEGMMGFINAQALGVGKKGQVVTIIGE